MKCETGGRNIKFKSEPKEAHFDEAFDKGAKFRDQPYYQGSFKKRRKEIYSSEDEFIFGDDEGPKTKKRKIAEPSSDEEGEEKSSFGKKNLRPKLNLLLRTKMKSYRP